MAADFAGEQTESKLNAGQAEAERTAVVGRTIDPGEGRDVGATDGQ